MVRELFGNLAVGDSLIEELEGMFLLRRRVLSHTAPAPARPETITLFLLLEEAPGQDSTLLVEEPAATDWAIRARWRRTCVSIISTLTLVLILILSVPHLLDEEWLVGRKAWLRIYDLRYCETYTLFPS